MSAFASHLLANALLLSLLLTTSHCLLKWVSEQAVASYLQLVREHWLLIGLSLAIYGFIFFYYLFVLRFQNLSSLYPVYTGLSIMLVFLSGRLLFNEVVTPTQLLGCALIVGGIFLVTAPRGAGV